MICDLICKLGIDMYLRYLVIRIVIQNGDLHQFNAQAMRQAAMYISTGGNHDKP